MDSNNHTLNSWLQVLFSIKYQFEKIIENNGELQWAY